VVHEIPAEWLPVRCETKRPAGAIGRDCRVCARNVCQEPSEVNISSTCKVGQKLGVSLPLLTCSPSAWPSRLLYRRGRKSRRDLWITLYIDCLSLTYATNRSKKNNYNYTIITTLKEEKHKEKRKRRKIFKLNIKVLMIRSSHRNSNREGKKSVFHHFCPGLPVSLTLCPTR